MSLHVERHGAGRDLVLLHGWGLGSGVWRGVLPQLASRMRVHCVDLPGYGGSRSISAGSFEEALDLLEEALPAEARVCGWSLGAQLAIGIARRAPRRVRSLLLVAATPCFVQRPGRSCAMSGPTFEDFGTALAVDADEALTRFVRLAALNGQRPREAIRALSAVLRDAPAPDRASLAATLEWLRANDLRHEVARLDVPATVLHGEADDLTPAAAGSWLAEAIPRAGFIGLPGCAHAPFITHAPQFVAAAAAPDD